MDKEQLTLEVNEQPHSETQDENSTLKPDTLEKEKKETKRKSRTLRSYPQYSIEEALIIAKSIGDNNSGNPWVPEQIAASMGLSTKTTRFIYLVYASRDYGFTTGTNKSDAIELTALGRNVVFPVNDAQENGAFEKAFSNIDVFKRVYEYYKDGGLPEKRFFYNTLQETFLIPSELHDEFYKVYSENIKFLKSKGAPLKRISSSEDIALSTDEDNNVSNLPVSNGKKDLFVIMPFREKTPSYAEGFFEEVFSSLIVPAASNAGFNPKTANKSGSDIIHKTIVSGIYNAEIILADLTEHNPNVLFELGLAIAFKKKVAIIRAKGTKPIFDVDNSIRVLDYSPNLWKSTLEMDVEKLTQHLIAVSESDSDCYLDIFLS